MSSIFNPKPLSSAFSLRIHARFIQALFGRLLKDDQFTPAQIKRLEVRFLFLKYLPLLDYSVSMLTSGLQKLNITKRNPKEFDDDEIRRFARLDIDKSTLTWCRGL